MNYLNRGLRVVDWVENVFISLLLLAIVVLVTVQVVSRYVLQSSLSWSEEINRVMFIYLVMIGISIGVRQGSHMGLHFLTRRMPFVLRHAVEILCWLVALAMSFLIFREAMNLIENQQKFPQYSPTTNWPIWWFTLAIPIGMGLTMLRIIQKLISLLVDWTPTAPPSAMEEIEREYPEVDEIEAAVRIRQGE